MWEPDTLRAGPAGPGRSEDGMSGKKKSGSARAVPRAYGRLTRHERDTVQRMLERRASCREIARELGRSPSTVSAEVASHRFATAPKARRGERVDATPHPMMQYTIPCETPLMAYSLIRMQKQ